MWRVSSPHTGQYGKMDSGSWSLRGHPDLQRTRSFAQVGSLCYAVRYLRKQSALSGRIDTTLATKHSVRLLSARCVLSGVATGALESVSAL